MATYVVDTDGTSGNYASLEAAINDISSLSENTIIVCQATGGAADTTACTIDITLNGYSLTIRAASGHEAAKTGWSTSKYRLSVTDSHALDIQRSCTIEHLQIENIYDSTASRHAVNMSGSAGSSTIVIDSCRLKTSGNTNNWPFNTNGASSATTTIKNTIFESSDASNSAYLRNSNSVSVIHCAGVYYGAGNVYGITARDMSAVITNSVLIGAADDFAHVGTGTDTITSCASTDGDGTNPVAPSGGDFDNEYADWSNGNLTLLDSGNCYHGGASGSGVTSDMDGDTYYAAAPSIGVDEYAAAGGETISAECSDGLKFSDSDVAKATLQATASDGLATSDTDSTIRKVLAMLADGASFSDSSVIVRTISAAISDGVSFSDSFAAFISLFASIADGTVFSDTAAYEGTISALVSDGFTVSDAASALATLHAALADGITLADLSTLGSVISALVGDGISLSDASSAAITLLAQLLDGITVSDSGAVKATFSVTAADGVEFADLVAVLARLGATVSDSITLTDSSREASTLVPGIMRVSFSAGQAEITFSVSRPSIGFAGAQPTITFTGTT